MPLIRRAPACWKEDWTDVGAVAVDTASSWSNDPRCLRAWHDHEISAQRRPLEKVTNSRHSAVLCEQEYFTPGLTVSIPQSGRGSRHCTKHYMGALWWSSLEKLFILHKLILAVTTTIFLHLTANVQI